MYMIFGRISGFIRASLRVGIWASDLRFCRLVIALAF